MPKRQTTLAQLQEAEARLIARTEEARQQHLALQRQGRNFAKRMRITQLEAIGGMLEDLGLPVDADQLRALLQVAAGLLPSPGGDGNNGSLHAGLSGTFVPAPEEVHLMGENAPVGHGQTCQERPTKPNRHSDTLSNTSCVTHAEGKK